MLREIEKETECSSHLFLLFFAHHVALTFDVTFRQHEPDLFTQTRTYMGSQNKIFDYDFLWKLSAIFIVSFPQVCVCVSMSYMCKIGIPYIQIKSLSFHKNQLQTAIPTTTKFTFSNFFLFTSHIPTVYTTVYR